MILVLGGTSDARGLAAQLRRAGYDVLVSVVSEYGARLAQADASAVRSGALDETTLEPLLDQVQAVIDASHPFAEQISALAAAACGRRGQPYLRYERPSAELPAGVLRAADAAAAARLAVSHAHSGPILLTVGSKTVATYVAAARAAGVRVVARVLPTPASLQACIDAGLEPADIIAMQGPSSIALDEALLRHFAATVLVTKESGEAGGVNAKVAAAQRAAATAIVVARPASAGEPALPTATPADAPAPTAVGGASTSAAAAASSAPTAVVNSSVMPTAASLLAVLAWLGRLPGLQPARPARAGGLSRGLLQIYTGEGKGKTTAATGLALRARGAGLNVTFIQFVKGGRESAELAPLRAAGVVVVRPAVARSGVLHATATDDDRTAAAAAWKAAAAALSDPECDLVVLDELHAALRHGLVDLTAVLAALATRPPGQEVVTTGRGAPAELLAAADLLTEMVARRHPYPGVHARRGVEF